MTSTRPRLASGDSASSSMRGFFAGSKHKSQSLRNLLPDKDLDAPDALPQRGLGVKAASSRNLSSRRALFAKQGSNKSRSLRKVVMNDDEESLDLNDGKTFTSSRGPPKRVLGERSQSQQSFSSLGSVCDDDSIMSGRASVKSKKSTKANGSRWGIRGRGKGDSQSDLSNQTIELKTKSRRPRLTKKSASVRSLDADGGISKPQDPFEGFQVYTREKLILPTTKDYQEAITTLCSDVAQAFLSLLAFLDIVLRPLLLLVWVMIQFCAFHALNSIKSISAEEESSKKLSSTSRSKRPRGKPKLEIE